MRIPAADVSIQHLNGLRLPSTADYFLRIESELQLESALQWAGERGLPVTLLGEGSNAVAARRVPGLVLQMAICGVQLLTDDGSRLKLRVAAGENWHALVRWTNRQGFHGLENLALIPGTVGAAPVQNIGAYGVEVANRIDSVRVYDPSVAQFRTLATDECQFGYRDSVFKKPLGQHLVIVSVDFSLDRHALPVLDYPELDRALGPSLRTAGRVFNEVITLRRRKLPDPALLPNVGSFFTNPTVSWHDAEVMSMRWPNMPQFPSSDGQIKLSAGWMIDHLGWRGVEHAGISVYDKHALVIVNSGSGDTEAVLTLAKRISDSIKEAFGIKLEMEPRLVGVTERDGSESR